MPSGLRYFWTQETQDIYRAEWKGLHKWEEARLDIEAARDCIRYAAKASWWEWDGGSCLFFWRWPGPFRLYARDGQPHLWT